MNNCSQKKQISINKNIVLSQIYIIIVCWAIFHVSSESALMPNYSFYNGFTWMLLIVHLLFYGFFRSSHNLLWYIWRMFWIVFWSILLLFPPVEKCIQFCIDNNPPLY